MAARKLERMRRSPPGKAQERPGSPQQHQLESQHSSQRQDDAYEVRFLMNAESTRGMTVEQKNKRRLARKADYARQSRKRKKEYVEQLENEIRELQKQMIDLEDELAQYRKRSNEQDTKIFHEDIMGQLKKHLAVEKDGRSREKEIGKILDVFLNDASKRRPKVAKMLKETELQLYLGWQSKFIMWIMSQEDEFYSKPGFWTLLMFKEVGASKEQIDLLLRHREENTKEEMLFESLEKMFSDLSSKCNKQLEVLTKQIEVFRTILLPSQIAKFLVWVDENKWCKSMIHQCAQSTQA